MTNTLFNRGGAKDLRQSVKNNMGRGEELASSIVNHFNKINSIEPLWDDKEIETLLLRQKEYEVSLIGEKPDYPKDLPRFSPSSADKTDMELFLKNVKVKRDTTTMTPWQKRWTENSTGVHEARQRNLLYGEKFLKNPDFTVEKIVDKDNPLRNGLPAWEKPLEGWKIVEHNGYKMVVTGMMDGILHYKDGSRVGFEFKTKSNSVAQIKQLKESAPHHRKQCIAYSILFGIDEFLLTYESVAKDKWKTAEDGRPDMKAFYIKVTERQRKELLDKWAGVCEYVENGELPPMVDYENIMFFPYKEYLRQLEEGLVQV